MPRIVHVSDIHQQLDWRRRSWRSSGWRGALGRFELHGMGRLRVFEGVHERIRRLVDALGEHGPDHVLLTGDLTALGDAGELAAVRALFAPFIASGRLTVVPGNHDRYTDAPHARLFERTFGDLLASDMPEYAGAHGYPFVKLVGDRLALIGLDSTRVSGLCHYFVGRLGEAQLEALGRVLDDARMAGRTAVVLLHHGPHGPSGRFHWRESGLLDGAALLGRLRDRPVVVHHGHSHHRYWHRRASGLPHRFGGGSSTLPGAGGFWLMDMDDHRTLEARSVAV